jgi:hypothetical protein
MVSKVIKAAFFGGLLTIVGSSVLAQSSFFQDDSPRAEDLRSGPGSVPAPPQPPARPWPPRPQRSSGTARIPEPEPTPQVAPDPQPNQPSISIGNDGVMTPERRQIIKRRAEDVLRPVLEASQESARLLGRTPLVLRDSGSPATAMPSPEAGTLPTVASEKPLPTTATTFLNAINQTRQRLLPQLAELSSNSSETTPSASSPSESDLAEVPAE